MIQIYNAILPKSIGKLKYFTLPLICNKIQTKKPLICNRGFFYALTELYSCSKVIFGTFSSKDWYCLFSCLKSFTESHV